MFERANARPGRRKLFTSGKQAPISRDDRARVMLLADASRRRGNITRAAVDVVRALLYQFANLSDGRTIPSHARIAEAAGCHERTVGRCLRALEDVGLVTWIHRLKRVRELVGGALVRVVRSSNSYSFPPAQTAAIPTDRQKRGGSPNPALAPSLAAAPLASTDRGTQWKALRAAIE